MIDRTERTALSQSILKCVGNIIGDGQREGISENDEILQKEAKHDVKYLKMEQ